MVNKHERDAIIKLADAINQTAIIVEEIGYYFIQPLHDSFMFSKYVQWSETLHKQREIIAELLPE